MNRQSRDPDRLLSQVVRARDENQTPVKNRKPSLINSLSSDAHRSPLKWHRNVSCIDSQKSRPSSGTRSFNRPPRSAERENLKRYSNVNVKSNQTDFEMVHRDRRRSYRESNLTPPKQSSVELPPISKNGLILEDADDVEYSISTNGGQKSERSAKNLTSLADSCKQIGKYPSNAIDRRSSYNSFAKKPTERQKDEIAQRKPLGFKTVVEPLRSAKSRKPPDSSATEEKFRIAKYAPLQSKLSAQTENGADVRASETPQTELSRKNSSNTNGNDVTKESASDQNSNLTPLQRCITAKRKHKQQQKEGEDFVVEIYLNNAGGPTKTVINDDVQLRPENTEGEIPDKNADIRSEHARDTVVNTEEERTVPTKEGEPSSVSDKAEMDPLTGNKPDETSQDAKSDEGVSQDSPQPTATESPALQPIISSATAFYQKYEEDEVVQPDDIFILGLSLPEAKKYESSPLTVQEAISLKRLVFGEVTGSWVKSWLNHPATMSGAFSIDLYHFSTSGIVAALQAHYIHQHFFANPGQDPSSVWRPTQQQKQRNLSRAVSNMLLQCTNSGQNTALIFCSASTSVQYKSNATIPHDGITERIEKYMFSKSEELTEFLDLFIEKLSGCKYFLVLLLYSLLLSRSPYNVRQDMLNKDEPLLLEGRCSRPLMSLLLTGVAAPCWLNDSVDLRNETDTRRGIANRVNYGILSCRQTKRNILVESNMMTPKLPIWIAEVKAWPDPKAPLSSTRARGANRQRTRFSVVFCSNKRLISDWKVERHFELHWLLACPFQVEKVKLTVDARAMVSWGADLTEDDFHSIETAIRTKWSDIEVDWNGSDPRDFGFIPTSQTAVENFK